jgi:thiol:disulfide interchange protein DsbD
VTTRFRAPFDRGLWRSVAAAAALAAACMLLAAGPAVEAQGLGFPLGELVTCEMTHSLTVFNQGSTGYLALFAEIEPGWHINANKPLESYLIPTVLEVHAPAGIEVLKLLYPEPAVRKLEFSPTKMAVYDGRATFGAIIRVSKTLAPGSYPISAALSYQGCNNLTCVEPAGVTAQDTIRVGTIEEAVMELSPDVFSRPPFVDASGQPVAAEPAVERDLGKLVRERGMLVVFVVVFLGGLALNLTPCIYPLIPITVSYFCGQGSGKMSRTFLLAILYVLGMAIMYSALGTAAALTGNLFGSALQNPWVILFIAVVLIALAASMFGLWEFRLPLFLTKHTGSARRGYSGAVVMGLTVGIIAAPCIGPFVLGLLTYVGNLGKPLTGFLLFFTLAWGMGIPFVVLAMISGNVCRLPRSGDWMVWVRKVFGFVLIAMALYFARNLLDPVLVRVGYAIIALAAGVYLGWLDRSVKASGAFPAMRRVIGIAAIALAIALLVIPAIRGSMQAPESAVPWKPFADAALAEAAKEGKPVVIDFTAAWCLACHELEQRSFPDPKVKELFEKVVPLRVDLTKSSPELQAVRKRFGISGLPTIIFIDGSGAEKAGLRVSGFIDARELERRLSALIGSKAVS